jgi:hypothetical protein
LDRVIERKRSSKKKREEKKSKNTKPKIKKLRGK